MSGFTVPIEKFPDSEVSIWWTLY